MKLLFHIFGFEPAKRGRSALLALGILGVTAVPIDAGSTTSFPWRFQASAAVNSDDGAARPCTFTMKRSADGLVLWSPDGTKFALNKKDAAGTYQLYVGNRGEAQTVCISCTARLNSPLPNRHKLQPQWHPSGKWIVLAGEWDTHETPALATPELIEGWIQSGLWVDIYMTRPDGSAWYRLSDFAHTRGDGFTGVAFTPDGTKGVWAQIVDGNIFEALFGKWELILGEFRENVNGVPEFVSTRNITPAGAKWVEPGNFSPDNKSLVITADVGLTDPQGMDQFVIDITTGSIRNLTNSPSVWDEHGVFSPDGNKIFFMSSYPFRSEPLASTVLFLRTEFMLMNSDGTGLQQITNFNSPGYVETNTQGRKSVAANGLWHPNGTSLSALNLFFPTYETWTIGVNATCGAGARRKPDQMPSTINRR